MNRGALGRAIRYLARYRTQALLPYIFLVIAVLSQLAVPKLLGRIIDAVTGGVIAQNVAPKLDVIPEQFLPLLYQQLGYTPEELQTLYTNAEQMLITAGVAIVAFAAVRGIFSFLQTYWAERNSQGIAFDMRNDLYAKISKLSFSYHDRNQTGQLMIRATDDVEKVRLFIGQGLLQAVGALVLLVGTLIILISTNPQLTLVVLPILPLSLVIFLAFGALSQPLFVRVQQRISALNTVLQENLAGIKVVKAFTREQSEEQKFGVAADALMRQQITVSRVLSFLFPLVFLIANVGQALVLYFGGRQIINNTLTLGQYQEFSLYLIFVFIPLAQLGFIISQMSQASASATRIFEILDTTSDVTDMPGASALPEVQGRVTFENVTFRYYAGGDPVLSEVSFTAEPGQTIALLGATGSGKTTIINLIPRFYDPSEGRVLIDQHDLREVTLESLRASIGIVLQETTLFTGTIRDNIAFGRPDASQEEIETAAKAAAAHDFILSFPQGYDTPVGERGATLSGGQKQRIAIARALLRDAPILILDEPTAALDAESEELVMSALERLMAGHTTFVIAHRLSTIRNADQIVVLERGGVVEQGRHEELLRRNGVYARLVRLQGGGAEQPARPATAGPAWSPRLEGAR